MPPNSKKKKAAKRKNQKKQVSLRHPNPNPNSQDAGSPKDDESEESFMTPRSQPDLVDLSRVDETDGLHVGESSNFEDEGSKDKKLEESIVANENCNGLDIEIPSNYDNSVKEMKLEGSDVVANMSDPQILVGAQNDDKALKETKESSIENDICKIEQAVHADDAFDYWSSANEKEVKVEPLPNEEMLVDNGDANSNVEVIHSEMGNEVDGNASLERDLKEMKLDERHVPVIEKSKEDVESIQQDLTQVAENFIDKTLEKSIEEVSIPVKKSFRATDHNGRVKESAGSFPDANKIEIAQRNEVDRVPRAVRRATIWNCCGLLEVLVGSDK